MPESPNARPRIGEPPWSVKANDCATLAGVTQPIAPTDLLDETMREGDARGFYVHTPTERIALVEDIQRVTAIRDFCVGWSVLVQNDADTLRAFIAAVREGKLRGDSVAHIFHFFQTGPQYRALVDSLPAADRERVAVDFATMASDEIAPHLDGPWLAGKLGRDVRDIAPPELHKRLADEARACIAAMRSDGLHHVGMIVQDAFRASYENLHTYVAAGLDGGASVIRLHDTVGIADPLSVQTRMQRLQSDFPHARFFCHFHNDLGMASANAFTALKLGAGADVTINGVGNRAGNAVTADVLMALKVILGVTLSEVRYDELTGLSRRVEEYFGLLDSLYAPVTGRLLFFDEASVRSHHSQTIGKTTWMPFDPADVGGRMESVETVTSGRGAIAMLVDRQRTTLTEHGVTIDDAFIDRAYAWCRNEQTRRRQRYHDRVIALQRIYEEQLISSYVLDTDIITAALSTRGRFDS